MWTLAEASKRSNDVLLKGIIETIIKESPILSRLPFETLKGTAHTYVRETTMPGAEWYSVGDTWVESSGTGTQYTASLKILGGDIDMDNFELKTLADASDLESENLEAKAKAVAHEFEDKFIYGNDTTNTKTFDGLHLLVDSGMVVHATAAGNGTGAALSMAKLDQMIDMVMPGRPDLLIMNRNIRRRIGQYYRDGSSNMLMTTRGADGIPLTSYGEIPIAINDFMGQGEALSTNSYSAKTGGATSSIFALKLGPKLLHGYENGGIDKERIGKLESKDATRWRLKWYVSLALKSLYALAMVDGITDATVLD